MDSLGQRIKEARAAKGMTQAQLATKAGLQSQSSIAGIEGGTRNPAHDTLIKIASALSTDPAWLIIGGKKDHTEKDNSDVQLKSGNTTIQRKYDSAPFATKTVVREMLSGKLNNITEEDAEKLLDLVDKITDQEK